MAARVESGLAYPYIPGKRGFPLTDLAVPGNKGTCKTGSGRTINYEFDLDKAIVTEPGGDHKLVAQVIRGVLLLSLRTVTDGVIFSRHHPDFRAGDFTRFVIHHYFPSTGAGIESFQGLWLLGSDNFHAFMQTYARGADKVAAARSTWSGKIMQENGFAHIHDTDVQIVEADLMHGPELPRVTAKFHRTPERVAWAAGRTAA